MAEDTIKDEEYTPITQGLRDYCEYHVSQSVHYGAILDMCAEIDAIHKALERECAEMRKELKERSTAGITEVMAFVDRLTDAAEKREGVTILGVDYTALPLDADGVPIHVGDAMSHNRPNVMSPAPVDYMELWKNYETSGWTIRLDCGDAQAGFSGCELRHHHKPTVADVLREFADGIKNQNADFTELAIERYAKLLQRVDGDAE